MLGLTKQWTSILPEEVEIQQLLHAVGTVITSWWY